MSALSLPRVLHPRKTSLEIEREVFEKAQVGASPAESHQWTRVSGEAEACAFGHHRDVPDAERQDLLGVRPPAAGHGRPDCGLEAVPCCAQGAAGGPPVVPGGQSAAPQRAGRDREAVGPPEGGLRPHDPPLHGAPDQQAGVPSAQPALSRPSGRHSRGAGQHRGRRRQQLLRHDGGDVRLFGPHIGAAGGCVRVAEHGALQLHDQRRPVSAGPLGALHSRCLQALRLLREDALQDAHDAAARCSGRPSRALHQAVPGAAQILREHQQSAVLQGPDRHPTLAREPAELPDSGRLSQLRDARGGGAAGARRGADPGGDADRHQRGAGGHDPSEHSGAPGDRAGARVSAYTVRVAARRDRRADGAQPARHGGAAAENRPAGAAAAGASQRPRAGEAAERGPDQSELCEKQFHEKFDKLKSIYVKLRDEHVAEIRKKAEVEKRLAAALEKIDQIGELEREKDSLEGAALRQSQELDLLRKDHALFNMETQKSVADACKEKETVWQELQGVAEEKEQLRQKAEELAYKILQFERQLDQAPGCHAAAGGAAEPRHLNRGGPAQARHPRGCRQALSGSSRLDLQEHASVATSAICIAHRLAVFILQGRATCNTSPDIAFGEKMAESCKVLGEIALNILANLKGRQDADIVVNAALQKLEEIAALGDSISLSLLGQKPGNLDEMFEDEMARMDKAIEAAAAKIQDMLAKSRAADSGIKLEVNEKILDSCTKLMQAIRLLVKKSRLLQAEIVGQGRGTASAQEFYKRNHQWTDGFISAAKAVGVAAQFLLTAADKVVASNGKLEQLVVAAQEIAASTAQLVVASRVKADRNSENLQQLTHASKGVTSATGEVVATVKDCGQLIEETEELDVSNLSLHQAKRLEMEAQVRVLELEKELEEERYRLAKLRRHHYQLAGEGDSQA
ncbi:hypothetical protein D910_07941 [Dendroctonus ponderosae]|uniref:I/LWEQ domain-containing protein n=1 Tax=Dendroctonus ponderosae TaxID=77166 RepID=U4U9J9_DENPD|nr:hypothetical protein D910_07941 [Dendroctonus ponderosae]